MGNANELYEIEKEIKYKHGNKKSKSEINEDSLQKHLNILEKYSNYEPDFYKISLIAAPMEHKNSLTISKFEYNEKKFQLIQIQKGISFEQKQRIFKKNIEKLKIDWRKGSDYMTINREKILESSISELSKVNLYKEVKIKFKGEEEGDAGGMMREWITLLFQEFQKSENKLFIKADTADFSLKVANNSYNEKNFNIYYFIGKILAKALLENLTINSCFNIYIYKIILDESVSIDDLIFIDTPMYHSIEKLQKLSDKEIEELELFFIENEKLEGNKIKVIELITDGSNVKVTKNNLNFYFEKKIEYIMNKDKIFINQIKKGLYTYIPENLLKIFNANELELILNGTPFIDVKDWVENTQYEGYEETDEVIINFWDIVTDFPQEKLSRLLQFSTGSTRVPIGGFKSLQSNRGNMAPFCICKVEYEEGKDNFIKAHTCFNRIMLPNFPNFQLLNEGIEYVIENEILGFGIE